jgi:hypothetical protein
MRKAAHFFQPHLGGHSCCRCAKIQARAKQAAAESQERQAQLGTEAEAARAAAEQEKAALSQRVSELEAGHSALAGEKAALLESTAQLEAEVGLDHTTCRVLHSLGLSGYAPVWMGTAHHESRPVTLLGCARAGGQAAGSCRGRGHAPAAG